MGRLIHTLPVLLAVACVHLEAPTVGTTTRQDLEPYVRALNTTEALDAELAREEWAKLTVLPHGPPPATGCACSVSTWRIQYLQETTLTAFARALGVELHGGRLHGLHYTVGRETRILIASELDVAARRRTLAHEAIHALESCTDSLPAKMHNDYTGTVWGTGGVLHHTLERIGVSWTWYLRVYLKITETPS